MVIANDGLSGDPRGDQVLGLAHSELDVSSVARHQDRLVARVQRRVRRADEPSGEFSLLERGERGIVPDTGDLVVLQPRVGDAQAELLETDAAAVIVGEVAVVHAINRVGRVDVGVEDAEAVLQVVHHFDALQRVTSEVDLQGWIAGFGCDYYVIDRSFNEFAAICFQ